jgi:hypothetical protein
MDVTISLSDPHEEFITRTAEGLGTRVEEAMSRLLDIGIGTVEAIRSHAEGTGAASGRAVLSWKHVAPGHGFVLNIERIDAGPE